MKIALVTEGDAEYASLPHLLQQINATTPHVLMNPLKVNCSPDATAGIIARECKSRVLIAATKKADLVVLLLDREDQPACPGDIADAIERAIGRMCPGIDVRVVLKDPYYESWLVADMDALAAQPKRFEVTPARRRRVEPDRADRANGMALIKQMVKGGHYDKVPDAERICSQMDLSRALSHSRSLRHFLHVVGWPALQEDCKSPPGNGARTRTRPRARKKAQKV